MSVSNDVLWNLVDAWEREAEEECGGGAGNALEYCADALRDLLGCKASEHEFEHVESIKALGKVIQRRVHCIHCNEYEWRIP